MKRQPKPLSERVLDALPSFEDAPLARDMAATLAMDERAIRKAFEDLDEAGKAKIVRRGNGLHLVPADHPVRVCPICRKEMRRSQQGKTCSKSCGMRVAWQKRSRTRQSAIMKENRRRHPEMCNGFIALRDDPEHRRFVTERNRQDWADPVKRMKKIVGLEEAWRGPGSEDRRERHADMKKKFWGDPEKKARAVHGMRTGKRGRYRRAVIDLMKNEPNITDEEIARRMGRTMEQTKTLMRRLYNQDLIHRAPIDGRKSQHSPEHVAKRVESRKRTMRANPTPKEQEKV